MSNLISRFLKTAQELRQTYSSPNALTISSSETENYIEISVKWKCHCSKVAFKDPSGAIYINTIRAYPLQKEWSEEEITDELKNMVNCVYGEDDYSQFGYNNHYQPRKTAMTYPISKFVEAAEALREEYENAEVTSSDTSITVSRTIVSEEGATYKYGIEFTPPDAEYDEELVELYVEDLYDSLYGEDVEYEDDLCEDDEDEDDEDDDEDDEEDDDE